MDDESISELNEACLAVTVAEAKQAIKDKTFLRTLFMALNP